MTFLIFSKFASTPRTCPKIHDKNTAILLQPRTNVGNGAVYIVYIYKMKCQKVSTNMIKREKNDSGLNVD